MLLQAHNQPVGNTGEQCTRISQLEWVLYQLQIKAIHIIKPFVFWKLTKVNTVHHFYFETIFSSNQASFSLILYVIHGSSCRHVPWCRCIWLMYTSTVSLPLSTDSFEYNVRIDSFFFYVASNNLNWHLTNMWVKKCYHLSHQYIFSNFSMLQLFHKAKHSTHASFPGGRGELSQEKTGNKFYFNSQMRTCYLARVWWLDCSCPAYFVNNEIGQVFWPLIQYLWWQTCCILKTCKNTFCINLTHFLKVYNFH